MPLPGQFGAYHGLLFVYYFFLLYCIVLYYLFIYIYIYYITSARVTSVLLTCAKFKVWMAIVESGWNVWVWLVGVVSKRRWWLVGVGGIYGCGYWVWL